MPRRLPRVRLAKRLNRGVCGRGERGLPRAASAGEEQTAAGDGVLGLGELIHVNRFEPDPGASPSGSPSSGTSRR